MPDGSARPSARLEVLYPAQAIAAAVRDLGASISRDLRGRSTFVVPVMNGALYFGVDLLRALSDEVPVAGFGAASVASYGAGTAPEGPPRITAFPAADRLRGHVVLVVDTILDSGATLAAVAGEARSRGAADVRVACLVDKPARRCVPARADWCAFTAPDRFLVGYGLDAGGQWRTLPYIAAVERDPV
jgi:hypoxanthine phosphoribosyltransferase